MAGVNGSAPAMSTPRGPRFPPPPRTEVTRRLGVAVLPGVLAVLAGIWAVLHWPDTGSASVVLVAVGLLVLVGAVGVLVRRPYLAPWGALAIFCLSSELRLRLAPEVGVAKDVYVLLLVVLTVGQVVSRPALLRRVRSLAGPLAVSTLLIVLYLVDPGGTHDAHWFYGTRLLVEVLVLGVVGLLCAYPAQTVRHLVRAMTVFLPLEAAFAWVQQAVGLSTLVYDWAYRFGSQVRLGPDGSLRTSGTFEDPFQLAALAVLGVALALFVSGRRQAVVLGVSAAAVLAATEVRTAFVQVGVLLLFFIVRQGWRREAVVLGAIVSLSGLLFLATTTASPVPGAHEEPLLFNLNGRITAWSAAVQGPWSLIVGNGVGQRGSGFTRADEPLISTPPTYDPGAPDRADYAGDIGFLDSSYAQVQSDVGMLGTVSLLVAVLVAAGFLARGCTRYGSGMNWAAFGVLITSMIDWLDRSSLASYTTGFFALYILGVLVAGIQAEASGERWIPWSSGGTRRG